MKHAAWSAMAGLLIFGSAPRAAEPVAGQHLEASSDVATAQPTVTRDAAPPGAQGMRAHIDPATGELIGEPATPEQRDQSGSHALAAPDYSRLTYETRPDGSVRAHANGQFQSTSTIQIEVDGSTRVGCTQSGPHVDHQHEPLDRGPQP